MPKEKEKKERAKEKVKIKNPSRKKIYNLDPKFENKNMEKEEKKSK